MPSQYGEEIDRILAKDGTDWTKEEQKKIEDLLKTGQRPNLKAARATLRDKA